MNALRRIADLIRLVLHDVAQDYVTFWRWLNGGPWENRAWWPIYALGLAVLGALVWG